MLCWGVMRVTSKVLTVALKSRIDELEARFRNVKCLDTGHWSNPAPSFLNQLQCMIHLAKIITQGALQRDEFRGAHYKPEFDLEQPPDFDPHEYIDFQEQKNYGDIQEEAFPPGHLAYMKRFEENDQRWLKTSIARFNGGGPEISYEDVNTSLIAPRPRKYD